MGAKPKLPPFWSLGWMQASYKWFNQTTVENVVSSYKQNNFPLDTIFLDIPYMSNYTDFTVNTSAFHDLPGFINELHQNKQ
jgi:alpha-glucosidase